MAPRPELIRLSGETGDESEPFLVALDYHIPVTPQGTQGQLGR